MKNEKNRVKYKCQIWNMKYEIWNMKYDKWKMKSEKYLFFIKWKKIQRTGSYQKT